MKLVTVLFLSLYLLSCGGGSSTNEVNDVQPSPAADTNFYSQVEQPVSFSDVTSLAYEPSKNKLFYGNSELQYVEYWSPIDIESDNNLPVLIFIHGGCWSNEYRINQSYPIATALALNGFHVWSVEYRATGDQGGGWPGTYNDIEQALAFISSVDDNYYTVRKQVVLGHSAGGHLALLAASNLDSNHKTIGVAAITQLATYANENGGCNSLAINFMNGSPEDIPEQYVLANPRLTDIATDAYLFVGEIDNIVNINQATNSGIPFKIVEGTGHFDWIHPGTASFTILLNYLLSL